VDYKILSAHFKVDHKILAALYNQVTAVTGVDSNHNGDLTTDSRWQYLYYTCCQILKSVHTCMHTDTKIYKGIKVYMLKIPFEFSEIVTSNVSAFLNERGLSLKE